MMFAFTVYAIGLGYALFSLYVLRSLPGPLYGKWRTLSFHAARPDRIKIPERTKLVLAVAHRPARRAMSCS